MEALRITIVVLFAGVLLAGCDLLSDDDEEIDLPPTDGEAVWNYLEEVDYDGEWRRWPGTDELYEGGEPHGMLLTTYVNEIAYEALMDNRETMPNGAIIVKENHTPEEVLASITTMYKVENYNEEFNDWFWLKNDPEGVIDAQGKVDGCQSCHSAREDNDYLFTGELGE